MDSESFNSILSLHTKIDRLTTKVDTLPCGVNDNRLKNLEKVVYGAIAIVLVSFMVSLMSYTGNKQAVANPPAVVQKAK